MSASGSEQVSIARLRLAQRCLITAMDADRELLTDESWQRALGDVTGMIEARKQPDDSNQLILFPPPAAARRAVGQ